MNAEFSLEDLIRRFWGQRFDGELKIWSRQTKRTSSYASEDTAHLVRDVEMRKHTEDLYIGLSTQPGDLGASARGSNETAILLPGFFADIDFATAKDSAKRYPPDSSTALELIRSFEFRPFFIQNTGNGLHALFKLDKPITMENREARRMAQALSRHLPASWPPISSEPAMRSTMSAILLASSACR